MKITCTVRVGKQWTEMMVDEHVFTSIQSSPQEASLHRWFDIWPARVRDDGLSTEWRRSEGAQGARGIWARRMIVHFL